ncbi:MAG: tetratricopeptide repeat protein, partial [Planctomycetota bacterium]
AASWVAGFPAEAEVAVDWTDAVPPLVAEGREPGGTWVELARFSTIRPGQTRFSFSIPGRVRAYSVRFVARDAAGNPAQAEIGPERVDPPIRLQSFLGEAVYPAGTLQKVSWELDPAAGSSAEVLLVRVEHRSESDSEWRKLCELSPEKQFLWELPAGGTGEHRLRVQLLRSGEVLGEDVSARFRIGGVEGPAPTAIAISEDSLFYSRRARETVSRYSELIASGAVPRGSIELEELRSSALADLAKAIEVDPKNYQATYSLASFLNRLDPAGNAAEVRKWLERTVEVKPDHASAWNDLGASALLAGDYARAEEHLRKSVAVRKSAAGFYNLGLALYYGEKFSDAEQAFREALAAGGEGEVGEGEIYYYLACCHVREGQVGAARAIYREKAGAIPDDLRAELSKMLPER